MCNDISRYMKSCSVLSLDDASLTAHNLNRVEEAIPEAYTSKCERPRHRSFHRLEHVIPGYQCYSTSDDSCHRKKFPVSLIYEHTKHLAEKYAYLFPAACMFEIARMRDYACDFPSILMLCLYFLLSLSFLFCLYFLRSLSFLFCLIIMFCLSHYMPPLIRA